MNVNSLSYLERLSGILSNGKRRVYFLMVTGVPIVI